MALIPQNVLRAWPVFAATAAATYARFLFSPLQETIHHGLKISDNQMAVLQGYIFLLPVMVIAIPLGLVIDRYPRVWIIRLFCPVAFAATVLTAYANGFGMLAVARALIGIAATAITISAMSLIADLSTSETRGRSNILIYASQSTTIGTVFVVSGAILAASTASPDAWRSTMLLMSIPIALVALLSWRIREPARTSISTPKPGLTISAFAEIRRHKAQLVTLIGALMLLDSINSAAFAWIAPILARNFGLTPLQIGPVLSIPYVIIGLTAPILGGALADRGQRTGGPRRTVGILRLLVVASLLTPLCLVMPNAPLFAVVWIVGGGTLFALEIACSTLITVIMPSYSRATALTIGLIFQNLVAGAAPLLTSLLAGQLGGEMMIRTALVILEIVCLIGAFFVLTIGQRFFPAATTDMTPAPVALQPA